MGRAGAPGVRTAIAFAPLDGRVWFEPGSNERHWYYNISSSESCYASKSLCDLTPTILVQSAVTVEREVCHILAAYSASASSAKRSSNSGDRVNASSQRRSSASSSKISAASVSCSRVGNCAAASNALASKSLIVAVPCSCVTLIFHLGPQNRSAASRSAATATSSSGTVS